MFNITPLAADSALVESSGTSCAGCHAANYKPMSGLPGSTAPAGSHASAGNTMPTPIEQVFRFDLTPQWVAGHWPRVSTVAGIDPDPDELREHVRSALRGSRTPDRVVFRDELPTNATGKVLRREIVSSLNQTADDDSQ